MGPDPKVRPGSRKKKSGRTANREGRRIYATGYPTAERREELYLDRIG